MSNWTLFSNHGHVLVCLARNPQARLRDVANDVGITERAVQKIVSDLHSGGMISVSKHGRRNHYRVHPRQNLRHQLEAHCTLGELLKCINQEKSTGVKSPRTTVEKTVAAQPLVKPVEKAEQTPPKQTRPEKTQPVKTSPEQESRKRDEPLTVTPKAQNTSKPEKKPKKPGHEQAIEKQQGSLF